MDCMFQEYIALALIQGQWVKSGDCTRTLCIPFFVLASPTSHCHYLQRTNNESWPFIHQEYHPPSLTVNLFTFEKCHWTRYKYCGDSFAQKQGQTGLVKLGQNWAKLGLTGCWHLKGLRLLKSRRTDRHTLGLLQNCFFAAKTYCWVNFIIFTWFCGIKFIA